MNDSPSTADRSPELSSGPPDASPEEVPRFGAVDIVEAFTAMRHEWRGQTKESRALAETIQQAVASLESLVSKRSAADVDARTQASSQATGHATAEAKPLALVIVELDTQLSRAVAEVAQGEANQRQREESAARAIDEQIAAMSGVARWFARPLIAFLRGQRAVRGTNEASPAVTGLTLVLTRLRRLMLDQRIERLDVLGQPFDAETMHAIGAVATTTYASGAVAEQLSPAYRWHGIILRFAEVRVAEARKQD